MLFTARNALNEPVMVGLKSISNSTSDWQAHIGGEYVRQRRDGGEGESVTREPKVTQRRRTLADVAHVKSCFEGVARRRCAYVYQRSHRRVVRSIEQKDLKLGERRERQERSEEERAEDHWLRLGKPIKGFAAGRGADRETSAAIEIR